MARMDLFDVDSLMRTLVLFEVYLGEYQTAGGNLSGALFAALIELINDP